MSALLAPSCQGHYGDPGVGKSPPSTVPPVWHACSVESLKWGAHAHSTVNLGIGTEETDISGIVGEVGHCQGRA